MKVRTCLTVFLDTSSTEPFHLHDFIVSYGMELLSQQLHGAQALHKLGSRHILALPCTIVTGSNIHF